ncbi:hypothetical protein CANCADRAFT_3683 [Tortispora caseinolytica NRRL Y-17796]|uniref:DUF4110 domain-containing protein n=1 Tax=Tortispora caseinolytica NRRL Y-17796 TaxID=767744 RepID=A0A1E4TBA5_9ASCO|nr:hypothetical protein CANCADRAFT_3683 [Tortispora caseinolytica NRRL Y-17796]
MAKKKSESKKKLAVQKALKAQSKASNKAKKQAAKEEEDDLDIDVILSEFNRKQAEFHAVKIESCDRPTPRMNTALVASPLHSKNELFLFGGESQQNGLSVFYNDLFVFSTKSHNWKKVTSPNTPLPRSGHCMCVHPTGVILLFGGEFSSPKQNTFYHYGDTWILDAESKEWTKIEGKSPSPRSGHRMTAWKHYVLLHGGFRDLSNSTTYLSDLWAFDVTTYKWTQIEQPRFAPPARSGHSFVPIADGGVIWGGYCKEKTSKGVVGKVLSDVWLLSINSEMKAVWNRRKRANRCSERVGCSMAHHKGRGILFGGVYDTEETDENIESTFFNDVYIYTIDSNKWFPLRLKAPKKGKAAVSTKSSKLTSEKELERNLSAILRGRGIEDSDSEEEQMDEEDNSSDNEDSSADEVIVRYTLPHPRFNAATTVLGDHLYIYGGIFETKDAEFVLDSMYAIDLAKAGGVKVIWEDIANIDDDIADESDAESDDFGGEDSEDETTTEGQDLDVPLAAENDDEALEELASETDGVQISEENPDPRPWLPHPRAFETLREFYARTAEQFLEWALSNDKEGLRGKELKRMAFELAEDRWWERREEVRSAEERLEDLGGVGDVLQMDQSGVKRGRR